MGITWQELTSAEEGLLRDICLANSIFYLRLYMLFLVKLTFPYAMPDFGGGELFPVSGD